MAKGGSTVPMYRCLMQKDGLRRVHDPHDDYPSPKPKWLRGLVVKLTASLHR